MKKTKTLSLFCVFFTVNTVSTALGPKKEIMTPSSRLSSKTSGKRYVLTCAIAGCCLGTTAQILGYNAGPSQGWVVGSLCSLTLPVVFKGISYYRSCNQKQQ